MLTVAIHDFSSQNVRVDATFDKDYFHVYSSSVNGTYHRVKTLKRGNTVIDGHLRAVLLDVRESDKDLIKSYFQPDVFGPLTFFMKHL